MRLFTLVISCCLLSLPLPGFAEDASLTTASLTSSAYLVKLTLSLAAILMLIGGLAWSVRKLGGGSFINRANDQLKLTAVVSVGARERVVLVQAGSEQILLGVTAGEIKKLHVLSTPQTAFQETLATEIAEEKAE